MKLYMHAAACSLSPHIICRELGLDIELVQVDRQTHRTSDGEDYLAINGNGYVPALMLDDGKVLTEGPAIVQFLADSVPEGAAMLPDVGDIRRNECNPISTSSPPSCTSRWCCSSTRFIPAFMARSAR
jgi:glutathione S-transferase